MNRFWDFKLSGAPSPLSYVVMRHTMRRLHDGTRLDVGGIRHVENLPVFGAIVLGLYVGNVASAFVNALAVMVLVAPHHAIAGARMFRSDQHGGIRTLRVLFLADRQLSVVD